MKKRIVNILTGGGGAPLNRIHYGRNPVVPHNYRRSCRDNAAISHWQH